MTDGFDLGAKRFLVSGRVQGVGYRAYAARVARSLRLEGGASNLPSGKVEVFARGPLHALDRLEAALWEGPRLSRVDKVDASESPLPDGLAEAADVTF